MDLDTFFRQQSERIRALHEISRITAGLGESRTVGERTKLMQEESKKMYEEMRNYRDKDAAAAAATISKQGRELDDLRAELEYSRKTNLATAAAKEDLQAELDKLKCRIQELQLEQDTKMGHDAKELTVVLSELKKYRVKHNEEARVGGGTIADQKDAAIIEKAGQDDLTKGKEQAQSQSEQIGELQPDQDEKVDEIGHLKTKLAITIDELDTERHDNHDLKVIAGCSIRRLKEWIVQLDDTVDDLNAKNSALHTRIADLEQNLVHQKKSATEHEE